MHHLIVFAVATAASLVGLLWIALLLTFLRIGAFARAPWLDIVVALMTWVPWVVGGIMGGWAALVGVLLGQVLTLYAWCWIHESLHPHAKRGPRIIKFINVAVGRWQNHLALWVTVIALPGFWFIRFLEITTYPVLVWLLNFPPYRQSDWINVSRQKFDGLVGQDLIWCLYCDWMTGVYALGAEMLRNVESFWCPIRYYDGKKCANCQIDFPDIANGWVDAAGTMQDVTDVMQEKYGDGQRAWFGHPVRLTVKGKAVE